MKRTLGILAVAGLMLLAACGGSSSKSTATSPSQVQAHIKNRIFVSNQFSSFGTPTGRIDIVDGDKDVLATGQAVLTSTGQFAANPINITIGGIPSLMILSADKKNTLVFDQQTNNVIVIDNSTESTAESISLGNAATSLVLLGDNKSGFAAMRSAGFIQPFDITTGIVNTTTIAVPTVRTLIPSHNSKLILAFSDDVNTLAIVDPTALTATTVTSALLDRPIFGIFSSDDSKAFILSCGAECGGTKANVSVLDVASGKITSSVPVSAATIGLLDSNGNLYVAGNVGTQGKLDVVATSNLTVSKSGVAITDGYHQIMALGSNNKLFIGARTCNETSNGCLSIYNTSAGTATIGTPKGDVTGLMPITGRNVVYVAEGGELRIYDTTKDAETNSVTNGVPIDIVGKAFTIVAPDQT